MPQPHPTSTLSRAAAQAVAVLLLGLTTAVQAAPPAAGPAPAASGMHPAFEAAGMPPPMPDMARKTREERRKAALKPVKLVDINHASIRELKTLPGIGDAEAQRIIANRPYWSKAQLVSKNVLPQGPYVSIRRQIVASQQGVAQPRRAASASAARR